jgi:hypothetical protein
MNLKKPHQHLAQKTFAVSARRMELRSTIDPLRLKEISDDIEIDRYLDATRRLQQSMSK